MKDYFGELEIDEPVKEDRFRNYTGERYCSWQVLDKVGIGTYRCRCDCGFETIKQISYLKGLRSMQCKKCYKKSVTYFMMKKGS